MNQTETGKQPWEIGPDEVEFEAHGFKCVLIREKQGRHWCGYVGIPDTHPHHHKDYMDIDYDVHGGLTYGDGDLYHQDNPDGLWWFGFDCAHLGDLTPGFGSSVFTGTRVYRDVNYVKRETEELAAQFAKTQESTDK